MVYLSARRRLVVIGNGMAGMRTVEELLVRAPDRFTVIVFGEEPHPNYNRIMLSAVLAGDKTLEEILPSGPEIRWWPSTAQPKPSSRLPDRSCPITRCCLQPARGP
ncbi:MAG: nirB [Rhodospirillaceae bacterium]|nr:MAG: nirB [Rhodospirillaceae bacterium]